MNHFQALSQFPAVLRPSAAQGGQNRSGLGLSGGQNDFEGFLTALAAGEAEAPGAARGLARLKAASLHNEMLANLLNLDGSGEDRAGSLVERANIEALMSSGRFGNLLPRVPGPETGLVLNGRGLNSWRNKNGPLSLGRPSEGIEGLLSASGPSQAFLIRPPQRLKQDKQDRLETPPLSSDPPLPAASGPEPAVSRKAAVEVAASKPQADQPIAEPAASVPVAPAAEAAAEKMTSEQLDKLVQKVALALNMDPNLIKAVIKAESNFNPQAVSKAGAKGLMQLMPGTAKELGVKDPFNPVENVWAGARYLKKMLDRHSGNINNALASYNWGPGNFDRHGKTRLPGETQRYITTVNKNYANFKQTSA